MSNKSPKKISPTSYSSLPSPVYPMFKKPSIPPTKSGLSLPSPVYPLNNNEKENEKDKLINLEKVVNGDEYNDENVTVLDLVVEENYYRGTNTVLVYYKIGNKKYLLENFTWVGDLQMDNLVDFDNFDNLKKYIYYSGSPNDGARIIADKRYKDFVDTFFTYNKYTEQLYSKNVDIDTVFTKNHYSKIMAYLYISYLKNIFNKNDSKCLFIFEPEGHLNFKYDNSSKHIEEYIYLIKIVFYENITPIKYVKNYTLDYNVPFHDYWFWFKWSDPTLNYSYVNTYNTHIYRIYEIFAYILENNYYPTNNNTNFLTGNFTHINMFDSEKLVKLVDSGYKYTDGKGKFYKLD